MHPMARDGLSASLCAGVLCACLPLALIPLTASPGPAEDRDAAVANPLAVQAALQQGRDLLQRGKAEEAVRTLEKELHRIDGSKEYLTTLRDAYRAYVKVLRLAGKDAEAEEFVR